MSRYLILLTGEPSNDPLDPDYEPCLHLGYQSAKVLTPEERKERYLRAQARQAARERSLVQQRNRETPEEVCRPMVAGEHDICITTITQLRKENRLAYVDIMRLKNEVDLLQDQLKNVKFSDSFLEKGSKEEKTAYYTGLPSHACFLWLATFCADILPKSQLLSPASTLLLTLMKLRLNFHNIDFSYRFNISKGHVSNLLNSSLL